MGMTKDELIAYVQDRYGVEPEYLWEKFPTAYVLRHQSNRKWFAVSMDVRRDRLGVAGTGLVCVIDLKCGPLLGGSYLGKPGVIPAWHMNKANWIGLLLDGSAEYETVTELLEISYDLTKGKS